MAKKSGNSNLNTAKDSKEDEFYTNIDDIANELNHYKHHFKNQIVYCNCDDPKVSEFFKYFSKSFNHLGLKKLITTCYKSNNLNLFSQNDSETSVCLEYIDINNNNVPDESEIITKQLKGDGDFRSAECIEILKEATIIVTNPPFSLFREYVSQLIKYEKKFLILGSENNASYKEIFPLIQENKIWLGVNSGNMWFQVPDNSEPRERRYKEVQGKKYRSLGNICWYTNLEISKRYEDLILTKRYSEFDYYKYDNYDAINVDQVEDIPYDYYENMGVPITFLKSYNPNQFEIIGLDRHLVKESTGRVSRFKLNGNEKYARVVIRRKR
jgi:hypothetical protein